MYTDDTTFFLEDKNHWIHYSLLLILFLNLVLWILMLSGWDHSKIHVAHLVHINKKIYLLNGIKILGPYHSYDSPNTFKVFHNFKAILQIWKIGT